MTLGSHQRSIGKSQVHLTPRWLIEALGPFDTDPCAADPRPWDCARINYTERDDGLSQTWEGRVWLNPPFNRYEVGRWIEKLGQHGNGICLVHARTETAWFHQIWQHANGILFMADRMKFIRPDGTEQPANSGAPIILAAFGTPNLHRLETSMIEGVIVREWGFVDQV